MPTVETRLRVRYAETDQMGVVYYANYLVWMEVGRVEYCRAAGLSYRDMERADGILLAVAEANCRYLAPARYDEEIVVRTSIAGPPAHADFYLRDSREAERPAPRNRRNQTRLLRSRPQTGQASRKVPRAIWD